MAIVSSPHMVDIFQDGEHIGDSELSHDGELLECQAPVSDCVLDALEEAIESGNRQIKVGPHTYSWSVATHRVSKF